MAIDLAEYKRLKTHLAKRRAESIQTQDFERRIYEQVVDAPDGPENPGPGNQVSVRVRMTSREHKLLRIVADYADQPTGLVMRTGIVNEVARAVQHIQQHVRTVTDDIVATERALQALGSKPVAPAPPLVSDPGESLSPTGLILPH